MRTLGGMFLALFCSTTGWTADLVAVPFGIGDSDSLMPFGLQTSGLNSIRYQQVYSAEPFAVLSPEGMWIKEIKFTDRSGQLWSSRQPLFQLNLSTTPRGPDNLSPVFAENVGPNDTVVFGPDSYLFGRTSETFGISLPMHQPFFFDPSQGNLLLDVRNFMPELDYPGQYDQWQPQSAFDVLGDPVSIVYAPDVNASVGTVDTIGLHTLFVVQVPEPSIGLLSLIGLAALAILGCVRKLGSHLNF